MRKKLLDILACPIDKYYPLGLLTLKGTDDVVEEGVLTCDKCGRYYPIIDSIPVMLPDELRSEKEELEFLSRWADQLPKRVTHNGKPFKLNK